MAVAVFVPMPAWRVIQSIAAVSHSKSFSGLVTNETISTGCPQIADSTVFTAASIAEALIAMWVVNIPRPANAFGVIPDMPFSGNIDYIKILKIL